MTLVRWDCWVLLGPPFDKLRAGPFGDAGISMTGMHGGRGAGDGRGLGCVQAVGRMCSVLGGNVSSFRANVFSFEGNVSTLAGDVSSFRRGALVGDGARTQGEIPRLRCAALGMTEAAGANRGRGWRMLAMMSLPATQSLHALLAVQVRPG